MNCKLKKFECKKIKNLVCGKMKIILYRVCFLIGLVIILVVFMLMFLIFGI